MITVAADGQHRRYCGKNMQDILMGINNGSQVDLTVIDVLLQYRNDSVICQSRFLVFLKCEYVLFWVGGVDYYGILRVVVNYEVRVVITTSHPYDLDQQCRKAARRERLYLKVGLARKATYTWGLIEYAWRERAVEM